MKNYNEILAENLDWAKETFAKIDKKMSAVTLRSRDKLVDGVDENGFHKSRSAIGWTSGFWGGLNWLLYNYTKNEEYLKTAKASEFLMDDGLKRFDELHHDVGFMWHILTGASYRLTGDPASRVRSLYAATTLMSRYVLCGEHGFIRAWNGSSHNLSIIDCLMNLPLLYWASEELGDDRFTRMAMAHADSTIKYHIRPDGSVIHIVVHDRETGECIKTIGGQGAFDGSSWSRGQAWALYGFVLSYLSTKEQKYLDAAKRVANYFIAATADDWIPRGDFRVADNAPLSTEGVVYDTSAGTCAACGLIDLANILPEGEGGMYMNAAIKMMRAMSDAFIDLDPSRDGFLYGTSARYPTNGDMKKADTNTSIIYGEFYFVEALLKLKGSTFNPWVK
jgi:unsaturated chondroitin disaccharide hydrolase